MNDLKTPLATNTMVPFETSHPDSNKKETEDESMKAWERFREWLTWYKAIELFLILGGVVLCIFAVYDMAELYDINEDFIDYDVGSGPLRLNLLGDSLINHPFHWFNLPKKINFFVNYQFTIGNYGENGQTISEIAARVDQAVYNPTPDALILFWDSDCSNINEYVLTVDQIYNLRQNYAHNVSYVINATLSAGVKYMAVAGPGFLGEGPFLLHHGFWHKVDMLNDYRKINEEVTASWNVTYINVRHEYIKDLPWYWAFNQWYLTREGEHENARGTRHVARLFGTELQKWLYSYNASYMSAPVPAATNQVQIEAN
eukprot:gene16882-19269_t